MILWSSPWQKPVRKICGTWNPGQCSVHWKNCCPWGTIPISRCESDGFDGGTLLSVQRLHCNLQRQIQFSRHNQPVMSNKIELLNFSLQINARHDMHLPHVSLIPFKSLTTRLLPWILRYHHSMACRLSCSYQTVPICMDERSNLLMCVQYWFLDYYAFFLDTQILEQPVLTAKN